MPHEPGHTTPPTQQIPPVELPVGVVPNPQSGTSQDTLDLARNKFPGSLTSLDALCKRFRIDNSKREKHTALLDCELLAKVYINLIDQKEPKLNFSNSIEKQSKQNNQIIDYSKKIISPSVEEFKKHKEFLKKNFKKNFF